MLGPSSSNGRLTSKSGPDVEGGVGIPGRLGAAGGL